MVLAAVLAGCTTMLPRGSSDTPSPFSSYAEASAAADRIVPFQTQVGQLAPLGFDPQQGKNVTVIPYPDILARLAPYSGVPIDQLDPGIRACISMKTQCRGYVFRFERQDRRREGNFLSDFFTFERVTHVTGWKFEALVVVGDDSVLFRNVAGEPSVERVERNRNPLGPLQPAGESAGSLLIP
ncbi:MAG: hypothetical protein K0S48_2490 [Ramlibacter sp.]|nr:hypothetical protein [Ramlibacter sp.]MCE3273974.1 hypothetical protein [Ramlibacter sp.]